MKALFITKNFSKGVGKIVHEKTIVFNGVFFSRENLYSTIHRQQLTTKILNVANLSKMVLILY